jgi:hypothetical protein
VVASRRPYWEWVIGRFGVLAWTWMDKGDGRWSHPKGAKVVRPVGATSVEMNRKQFSSLLVSDEVDVVLFDEIAPRVNDPVWNSASVKLVIWSGGTKEHGPPESWSLVHWKVAHSELGGVTNGVFHMWAACRSTGRPLPQLQVVGVSATLSHVVSPTQGKGRLVPIPSVDEPTMNTARGLLDWKNRFGTVIVPTVYSHSHWVRRRLVPSELGAVLDIPADVASALSSESMELLTRTLLCPIKVRSAALEVMERLWEVPASPEELPTTTATRTFSPELTEFRRVLDEPFGLPIKRTSSGCATPVECEARVDPSEGGDSVQAEAERLRRTAKASKSDDAGVPEYLWDDRVKLTPKARHLPQDEFLQALKVIRGGSLTFWKRSVAVGFAEWWKKEVKTARREGRPPPMRSLIVASKALAHAADASWWDWDRGSAPFFWRWPTEFQEEIRDGMKPRFTGPPPSTMKPQQPSRDPSVAMKERSKLDKFRFRGSVEPPTVPIRSLMSTFSVAKGDDIRMVFDASKSKLNEVLFAPWFALATADSMYRTVGVGYYGADNDYGEMFYNWWLHEDLRPYCGIDMTHQYPEEARLRPDSVLWNVFTRPAMGLRPSPYQSVQGCLRAKRLMLGDRKESGNVFKWDYVDLNQPGDADYQPGDPWISKRRDEDGLIAADIHSYVDDNRETAPTAEMAWLASSRVAKMCSWLGLQDAARKRRPPSQEPGAWAGSVVHATETEVTKLVSQERWDKTRRWISWMYDFARKPGCDIPHKALESCRGFLVYVARTYGSMVPYLKGIHHTLDSWRPGRDANGWKFKSLRVTKPEDLSAEPPEHGLAVEFSPRQRDRPPQTVKAVLRFRKDIEALMRLTVPGAPPKLPVRPSHSASVWFAFGDASGRGFGVSLWLTGSNGIDVCYGSWDREVTEERSSNFKEFLNLVQRIEEMFEKGLIVRGTEIFVFTDNWVTEQCFFKGTSTSSHLFELVLRLRELEMRGNLFVHLIWVAGTRMIEQGTDGLSRGDLSNGVMAGDNMLAHVPLNRTAFGRSPKLKGWLLECSGPTWEVLTTEGWYDRGHQVGNFVWAPSPAVADAALEQLCESRHTRPQNAHMFVCPALMTARWRKQLRKVADLMFTIRVGPSIWPCTMHEPVTIALICPFLHSRPWKVGSLPAVGGIEKSLSGVWSESLDRERSSLRQFWDTAEGWDSVSGKVAR